MSKDLFIPCIFRFLIKSSVSQSTKVSTMLEGQSSVLLRHWLALVSWAHFWPLVIGQSWRRIPPTLGTEHWAPEPESEDTGDMRLRLPSSPLSRYLDSRLRLMLRWSDQSNSNPALLCANFCSSHRIPVEPQLARRSDSYIFLEGSL